MVFPFLKVWIDSRSGYRRNCGSGWLAAQDTNRALSGLAWAIRQLARTAVLVR
jgi:hypothetical protein